MLNLYGYALLKPLLFRIDPERIHRLVMQGLRLTVRFAFGRALLTALFRYQDSRLSVQAFGLTFPNPVCLAAGFDKNAEALPAWESLGFGGVEIGSVTALAQPGNPKPRLFRLPEDQALLNRMGFNNAGAEAVARELKHWFERCGRPSVPLGINLGKSKVTPLEEAPEDYRRSMALLWPYADYFVINVSSPNTPGLRELQEKDKLLELLTVVQAYADERSRTEGPRRPILLKIAPDLTDEQLDEIAELVLERHLDGLIATNTTVARTGLSEMGLARVEGQAGGLSGRPLAARSLEVLCRLRAKLGDQVPLVSVGGIFEAADVKARLLAGATLVQVYSGFVYGGPSTAKRMCRALVERESNRR